MRLAAIDARGILAKLSKTLYVPAVEWRRATSESVLYSSGLWVAPTLMQRKTGEHGAEWSRMERHGAAQ